jgi:hypothetical protein
MTPRARRVGVRAPELDAGHPLLRASEAVAYTWRQCLYVAAVLIGSVIGLIQTDRWVMPLAYSSAGVLLVLTGLLFAHVQRERDCALTLILEGRETLGIAPVERQRKRLLAKRTRKRIVDDLEEAVRHASRPACLVSLTPPRFEPSVIGALTRELHRVMRLLGDEGCSARAVASAERLVEQELSPLYGRDVDALRDELRRLCDLLEDRDIPRI